MCSAHHRLRKWAQKSQIKLYDVHPSKIPAPFTAEGQRLFPKCAGRAKGNPSSTQESTHAYEPCPWGSDCYAAWWVLLSAELGLSPVRQACPQAYEPYFVRSSDCYAAWDMSLVNGDTWDLSASTTLPGVSQPHSRSSGYSPLCW